MAVNQKVLGLIAGQGRLPFMVAEGAKKSGFKVVCVGLADSADPALAQVTDVFYNVALARPGSWIKKLKKHNVTETIMVGRVAKKKLFTPFRILRYLPDTLALRVWYWTLRKKDKRNDTLLGALANELAKGGIILEDSTMHCKEQMAEKGTMTKTQPPASILSDIDFGWAIVKECGRLDIGQAIAVKEREVIAVEAIEGTAKMIERAGQYCKKGGWTLIKTAKPNQDMRFDVPCVGPDTIKSLSQNGGKCLVIEAEKTIIIDKPQTLTLADKLGIAVVGC
ncbi:MAG: UDP-2,3-diacylglucosamine diphosphatase LpxI [Planctomycetes bacterium]|nr:UDP-2,3-diacylglucosamine diphosphatase LpxI [Planctomycetota bacterium]MBL7107514.1 UDP-2,3-diacylglucosamine diphosphatase LpxI [Phycisphaerae bacterium]